MHFTEGTGNLTPPSEKDGSTQNGMNQQNGAVNGQQHGSEASNTGNGVMPATPAATPAAGSGVSGIVPTLQ